MSEEAKKLYEMELHETIKFQDNYLTVMRVIGGWIYTFHRYHAHHYIPVTSIFVPFDNEQQIGINTKQINFKQQ